MKLLFVCNQNQNRSKTAEELLKDKFQTKSAGLFSSKSLTNSQMEWADAIIVMDEDQRQEISKRFPKQYLQKRILSLDIPDIYQFNQPQLVKTLKSKFNQIIKPIIK
ncbi:MAG: phosphotyrosine protein phosphatase [Nanoarchaeota archaeon]|nr:phosphotyrosine protein phosphatase [Nanoarchaeota archaeon]